MNKCWMAAILFMITWGSASAFAREAVTVIFYYPGGEGSQEEATGIMDMLSEALGRLSGNKIEARYYPDELKATTLMHHVRNAAILMRIDSFLAWPSSEYPLHPHLIAQPIYTESHYEKYRIYAGKFPVERQCDVLFLGSRLSERYRTELFGKELKSLKTEIVEEPLAKLEEIAERATLGSRGQNDCLLLDNRQWKAVEEIPFSWKESLCIVKESAPIFAPILFSTTAKPNTILKKVLNAFEQLNQSGRDLDLLTELELKGFLPLSEKQKQAIRDGKVR